MPGPDSHKNYSASALQRYHAGLMTDAEMHALEKAALEDPFLAEALEGYGTHESAEADIEKLRSRITGRQQHKHRSFPLLSRNFLYKAAAILVFGLGIFYLGSLLRQQPGKEVVLADKIKETSATDSAQVITTQVEQAGTAKSSEVEKNKGETIVFGF